MQAGFFEKQIVLTPDLCGSAAALSPLAAFTIFQGVASEHAERIGVGGAAMAKRGEEPYRTLCLRSGRPADGVLSNGQLFKGLLKDLRDKTEQYL